MENQAAKPKKKRRNLFGRGARDGTSSMADEAYDNMSDVSSVKGSVFTTATGMRRRAAVGGTLVADTKLARQNDILGLSPLGKPVCKIDLECINIR